MHASSDPRLLRTLDALEISFAIFDSQHQALYPKCLDLLTNPKNVAFAFDVAWSIVDTVHRIREVAQAVPGLNTKRLEVRRFLTATALAETLRHYIQHLRNELLKQPENPYPVWGSLAWADATEPMMTHTVLSGASRKGLWHPSGTYDLAKGGWGSRVTLTVGTHAFEFDPIAVAVHQFADFIVPWIRMNYGPEMPEYSTPNISSVQFLGMTRVEPQ